MNFVRERVWLSDPSHGPQILGNSIVIYKIFEAKNCPEYDDFCAFIGPDHFLSMNLMF